MYWLSRQFNDRILSEKNTTLEVRVNEFAYMLKYVRTSVAFYSRYMHCTASFRNHPYQIDSKQFIWYPGDNAVYINMT